jgi:hypothetical protein
MTEKKTTYELRIGGNIEDLKKALGEAKKALDNLDGSNFSTGLDKKFGTILN